MTSLLLHRYGRYLIIPALVVLLVVATGFLGYRWGRVGCELAQAEAQLDLNQKIRRADECIEPLLGDAAERLLQQDIKPKAAAVNARVSVPLFQGQFDAVVSWTYNLGEGALKSSTMLQKINAARHEEVPEQMKRWNRAGGKVLKGLERRREAEAAMYEMRWY
jgi:lysozyme